MKPITTLFKAFLERKQEKKMTQKLTALIGDVNRKWDSLRTTLLNADGIYRNYQAVTEQNSRFYADNSEDYNSQSIVRQQNHKRLNWLLAVVMVITSLLAIKGLKFFLDSFYGPVPTLIVLFVAITLALLIIKASIYINTIANSFRENNIWVFYFLKFASFLFILFIPAMNLFEGFQSSYTPIVMALNIFAILIDVIINAVLVLMSNSFAVAENAKQAKKTITIKMEQLATAEKAMQVLKAEFKLRNDALSSTARELVYDFKKFEVSYPKTAANLLFLLDNATIWVINNRIFENAVLSYHTDEQGRPVIEKQYFTERGDLIRAAYDELSKVNNPSHNTIQHNVANNEEQQPHTPHNETNPDDETPSDYESFLDDNTNRDDKYL